MLQNVNLFGAFLKDPEPSQPAAAVRAVPAAQPPGTVDLVLKALGDQPGAVVPLKALLDLAGGSLQVLLDAVTTLAARRLVEEVDGGVRITDFGKDIAASLRPATR